MRAGERVDTVLMESGERETIAAPGGNSRWNTQTDAERVWTVLGRVL